MSAVRLSGMQVLAAAAKAGRPVLLAWINLRQPPVLDPCAALQARVQALIARHSHVDSWEADVGASNLNSILAKGLGVQSFPAVHIYAVRSLWSHCALVYLCMWGGERGGGWVCVCVCGFVCAVKLFRSQGLWECSIVFWQL